MHKMLLFDLNNLNKIYFGQAKKLFQVHIIFDDIHEANLSVDIKSYFKST